MFFFLCLQHLTFIQHEDMTAELKLENLQPALGLYFDSHNNIKVGSHILSLSFVHKKQDSPWMRIFFHCWTYQKLFFLRSLVGTVNSKEM